MQQTTSVPLLQGFKNNLATTFIGGRRFDRTKECKGRAIKDFAAFHNTHLTKRKVEDWRLLTEMGNALRFYSVSAIVTSLDVISNLLRAGSGQWFYPPSQYITIFAFTLDSINYLISAYGERAVLQEYGHSVRLTDAQKAQHATESKKIVSWIDEMKDGEGLTPEKRNEFEALVRNSSENFHGLNLGDHVGRVLVDQSLVRRVVSIGATVSSLFYVASAIIALIVQSGEESIVPLNNQSSPLAIASHVCVLTSCLAAIPFFISLAKDTFGKITSSREMVRYCRGVLGVGQFDNGDDVSLLRKSAFEMIYLYQRVKELCMRCFALSTIGFGLAFLAVWELCELSSLGDEVNPEGESISRFLANALNMPVLVTFAVASSAYLLNFIIKWIADGHRYILRCRAQKAFKNINPEANFYKRHLCNFLATNKHMLLWVLSLVLKAEANDEDTPSPFNAFLKKTGLTDEELEDIRQSGTTPQEVENCAFLLANSKLGLVDTV